MTALQIQVFSLIVSLPGADARTLGALLHRQPCAIGAVAFSLRARRLIVVDLAGRMYPDAQVTA